MARYGAALSATKQIEDSLVSKDIILFRKGLHETLKLDNFIGYNQGAYFTMLLGLGSIGYYASEWEKVIKTIKRRTLRAILSHTIKSMPFLNPSLLLIKPYSSTSSNIEICLNVNPTTHIEALLNRFFRRYWGGFYSSLRRNNYDQTISIIITGATSCLDMLALTPSIIKVMQMVGRLSLRRGEYV